MLELDVQAAALNAAATAALEQIDTLAAWAVPGALTQGRMERVWETDLATVTALLSLLCTFQDSSQNESNQQADLWFSGVCVCEKQIQNMDSY